MTQWVRFKLSALFHFVRVCIGFKFMFCVKDLFVFVYIFQFSSICVQSVQPDILANFAATSVHLEPLVQNVGENVLQNVQTKNATT